MQAPKSWMEKSYGWGRVLAVTGKGKNMSEAIRNSYDAVTNYCKFYCRNDIGQDI